MAITYYDKIPLKTDLKAQGVRVVPPERSATVPIWSEEVRDDAGYVNIGAYVVREQWWIHGLR